MAAKLFNLLALSTLAILASSFQASPVNALATGDHHFGRGISHAHSALAKKKRGSSGKRCKPRPSSIAVASSTSVKAAPASSTKQANVSTDESKKPKTSAAAPSASAAPAAPASHPTSGGGSKVGLAWANGDDSSLKFYKTDKTKFLYSWSPSYPSQAKSLGFTPVPMLWGFNQVTQFQNLVKQGYAEYAMGMNEPNQKGQSDMTAQQGAKLWKEYLQPLKALGYTLVSPATTSAPSGKQWMSDWINACDGCTYDILAFHWYDIGLQKFQDYATDFHTTFKKDIWVTEMAEQNFNGGAQASASEIQTFMTQVTAWMDSTPWIGAYFYFGIMHDMQGVNTANQLMASNGQPTELGKLYIGA